MLEFNEDNGSYEWWIAANPDQFVINAEHSLNPATMILHRANCRSMSSTPTNGKTWVDEYVKICGTRRELLTRYPTARPCHLCLR
ncbi:hypothetical protein KCV87_28015 [Actinosynnema pretiosum subsp. pretiosum]|uniref:Uncharacterized protein n=2 Tax=Actinosynnema TaxID=40566 RepID=C6WB15_ACTMD|nr:hypothetical protein [Actinosynnema mirum]ACU39306.1 hypothetical protein Amir_5488 [Actinosynnema mirum DSM 43827]AXX32906.1 hypothetical protein APASM_5541 [Actinosynnema pretiosum subsp. pretiosum]QUF03231.1 hypothetical protein KCV87_28015 [Actinosynnema pretiosum subsp. pretiosum]